MNPRGQVRRWRAVWQALCCGVALTLSEGCATYTSGGYSIASENAVALRSLGGLKANLGSFGAATPGQRELSCRGFRPVKTQQGEVFSEFVRNAFLQELRFGDAFSPTAPVTISGTLDAIEFSSIAKGEAFNANPARAFGSSRNGNWHLALTLRSSNGKTLSVTEDYPFESSLDPEAACGQTARALVPAVQGMIGKVFGSAEFRGLVAP